MKETTCERWLDKNFYRLVEEYSLQHWQILCRVQHSDDGEESPNVVAYIDRDYAYMRAAITFYYDRTEDLADLEDSLRHELEHLLLAPYDQFITTLDVFLPKEVKTFVQEQFRHVKEQTRHNVGKLRKSLLSKKK